MTLDDALKRLEANHQGWLDNPHTSRGQREDSRTILALIEAARALEGMMNNVALDWYVQQFAKDTTPKGDSSGIAARIHNEEVSARIAQRLEEARQALAALTKALGG